MSPKSCHAVALILSNLFWVASSGLAFGSFLLIAEPLFADGADRSDQELAVSETAINLRPLSSSLPVQVLRVRSPFILTMGDEGFSRSGSREQMGFEISRASQTFAFEFGVSSSVTLSVALPFIYRNELSFVGQKFRGSSYYEQSYQALIGRVAEALRGVGICGGTSSCQQLIEAGYALPRDQEFELSKGESVLLRAGVPLETYIDSIILNAVRPESGRTGAGDLEVAALYEIVSLKKAGADEIPFGLAVAAGARLPTGSYADVPRSQRATGRGSVDLGVQVLADYLLEPHTLLSAQFLAEWDVISAERKPSRLSDGRVIARSNTAPIERDGPKTAGLVRLEYAAGGLHPAADFLTLEVRFSTTREPAVRQLGRSLAEARASESFWTGARVSGLGFSWPVAGGVLYEHPVSSSGEAALVAPQNLIAYAELYWAF